ncbi:hypothetical protein HAX54_017656 [Datura stramonium]|uniref:Uncharacterized protein n=1 Tax=Datura stramonium TaxID=4076 RepID=A0ABS8UNZ4_DATST|nr:hypothetical protein [Datura stramonium]
MGIGPTGINENDFLPEEVDFVMLKKFEQMLTKGVVTWHLKDTKIMEDLNSKRAAKDMLLNRQNTDPDLRNAGGTQLLLLCNCLAPAFSGLEPAKCR